MSIYQFVRGPRLFIQAAREQTDPDNVNGGGGGGEEEVFEYGRDLGSANSEALHRVHTQRVFNTESHGSASASNRIARKSGVKSITRKIIRKTTTLTRGEQSISSDDLVTETHHSSKHHPSRSRSTSDSPQRYVTEKSFTTLPWGVGEDELQTNGGRHASSSYRHRSSAKESFSNSTKSRSRDELNGNGYEYDPWTRDKRYAEEKYIGKVQGKKFIHTIGVMIMV